MTIGGEYLHRALQQKLPKVLMAKRKKLLFENGVLIPTDPSLVPGAREVVQDQISEHGEAALMSTDASDIPLVEITASENNYRVAKAMAGFSISYDEEQAAAIAATNGVTYNVRNTKQTTAARVIGERLNDFAAYGSTNLNVTGLVNDGNVTLTDSSFDPYDANSSAEDIADFILEELTAIATATNNVEDPTDLIVDTEFWGLIRRRTMKDSATPVLDFIKARLEESEVPNGIQNIYPRPELLSTNLEAKGVQSAGTNKSRFVLYARDEELVCRYNRITEMLPFEFTEVRNGRRLYLMQGCSTETIVKYPGSMRYVDAPKKS
ncbi:MAG: major capsid family protein [Cyanobacteria bacterium P01_F01_bin.150]